MQSLDYKWIILKALLLCSVYCIGQQPIYLQVEEMHSSEIIRYYPGQTLNYTTTDYADTWRKSKIVKIIPEDQLIILEDNFIRPEEIYSLRRNNKAVLAVGHGLSKFAAGWLGYGAIATVAGSRRMDWREVVIGSVAAALGWTMRKLFGKKKMPLGKFYRLRIMDIRFPEPKFNTP